MIVMTPEVAARVLCRIKDLVVDLEEDGVEVDCIAAGLMRETIIRAMADILGPKADEAIQAFMPPPPSWKEAAAR